MIQLQRPHSPTALIIALRRGDEAAHIALATASDAGERAARRTLRAAVVAELALQIAPSDRQIVRWLLEQEVADLTTATTATTATTGDAETLYTLVAALARFAHPEDVPLLWRARQATDETRTGVDVEQLLRAGPDRVRAHLTRLIASGGPEGAEARAALAWIEEGIAQGAADDLPAYFSWSDERFGVGISCSVCRIGGPYS